MQTYTRERAAKLLDSINAAADPAAELAEALNRLRQQAMPMEIDDDGHLVCPYCRSRSERPLFE